MWEKTPCRWPGWNGGAPDRRLVDEDDLVDAAQIPAMRRIFPPPVRPWFSRRASAL